MMKEYNINKTKLMWQFATLVIIGLALMAFIPSIGACPVLKPKHDAKTVVGDVTNEISGTVAGIDDNGGVIIYMAMKWGCEDSQGQVQCRACCDRAAQQIYDACVANANGDPDIIAQCLASKALDRADCVKDCCVTSQPVPPKPNTN